MTCPTVLLDMDSLEVQFMKLVRALGLISLVLIWAPVPAANVGDVAPDFEIASRDGGTFHLSDFRGKKPVYVIFWNTWCSYCIRKTPRYQKLQKQFGDKIEIIAINTSWSDSAEEMRAFEEQYQLLYSTAFDAGEHITDRYKVVNVPTEFIVDIDGIVRYRDRVPEYLAAHLPDWVLPYIPSKRAASLVCTP